LIVTPDVKGLFDAFVLVRRPVTEELPYVELV